MAEENKNGSGAPSTDTTSALFVSARKKQLEQQEEARRAKEKEAQRLSAEAEVRRLEQEVEERRRKAEEAALLVETQAREKREQARDGNSASTAPMTGVQQPALTKTAKKVGKTVFIIIGGICIAVVALFTIILMLPVDSDEAASWDGGGAYDIIGAFYYESNPEAGTIHFYSDYTFDMQDSGGMFEAGGTWSMNPDDSISLVFDEGNTIRMSAQDNNTIIHEGDFLYRVGTGPAEYGEVVVPAYSEVDPDATLDALAELADIYMGVRYPSDIFQIVSQDGSALQMESTEPDTAIYSCMVGDLNEDRNHAATNQVGAEYADSVAYGFDSATVLSESLSGADGEKLMLYERVMEVTLDGESYLVATRSSSWITAPRGKPTDTSHYLHMILIVRAEVADGYLQIFRNMQKTMVDL